MLKIALFQNTGKYGYSFNDFEKNKINKTRNEKSMYVVITKILFFLFQVIPFKLKSFWIIIVNITKAGTIKINSSFTHNNKLKNINVSIILFCNINRNRHKNRGVARVSGWWP